MNYLNCIVVRAGWSDPGQYAFRDSRACLGLCHDLQSVAL